MGVMACVAEGAKGMAEICRATGRVERAFRRSRRARTPEAALAASAELGAALRAERAAYARFRKSI